MVGYRALEVSETVHRGMPSSMLTFIVSLDDGVEAAWLAEEFRNILDGGHSCDSQWGS
jgi:hypothetical protein